MHRSLHEAIRARRFIRVPGAGAVACTPINPCGTFAFTGTANDGATSNGITMNFSFDFDPAVCGSNCTTITIACIQMVRTYNLSDGAYSYILFRKSIRHEGSLTGGMSNGSPAETGVITAGTTTEPSPPISRPGTTTTNAVRQWTTPWLRGIRKLRDWDMTRFRPSTS